MSLLIEVVHSESDEWPEGYPYRVKIVRFIRDPEYGLPPRYGFLKDLETAEMWVERKKFEITMYEKYAATISVEEWTGNPSEPIRVLSTHTVK